MQKISKKKEAYRGVPRFFWMYGKRKVIKPRGTRGLNLMSARTEKPKAFPEQLVARFAAGGFRVSGF